MALLSALVLKASCHHYSGNEYKIEQTNKRIMIRGSVSQSENPQNAGLHGDCAFHLEEPKLFESMFNYLKYFEELYEKKN